MTLPDERYRALERTEQFMIDLCNPRKYPRVPREVRDRARSLLRHYPSGWDLERLAAAAPEVIVKEMESVHRFITVGSQSLDGEGES